MKDRKPIPKALNLVVSQFDHAPLCNPDGITGINLHLQVDEEIPNEKYIDIDDLKRIKTDYLGTIIERNNTNYENIRDAKDLVFYYSLFADTHKHPWRFSGEADGIPLSTPDSTDIHDHLR